MMLKKIRYFGEDVRKDITVQEAVELLGAEVVAAEFATQSGKSLVVDSDYRIRFYWSK